MAVLFPDILKHNNPVYPIVSVDDIQGITIVASLSERASIDALKRRLGHIINVIGDQIYTYIGADTLDATWVNVANWASINSSGVSVAWGSITGNIALQTDLTSYFVPQTRTVNGKALSSDIVITTGDIANVATLDGNGKLTQSQIPDITISEFLGTVDSQANMLLLTGQKGDWCIRSDESKAYFITGNDPTQIGSWTAIPTPSTASWGTLSGYPTDNIDFNTEMAKKVDLTSTVQGKSLATSITFTPYELGSLPDTPILSIGESQNLLLQTESFNNATWIPASVTVSSADTVLNPGWVQNAESLTATVDGGSLTQTVTDNGTGLFTFSIWLKCSTGTVNAKLRIDCSANNGIDKSIIVTNSWTRYFVTQNFANPNTTKSVRIMIDTAPNVLYSWGAQLEAGGVVSAYSQALTTTAMITRDYIFRGSPTSLFEFGKLTINNTATFNQGSTTYGLATFDRDDIRINPTAGIILHNNGVADGTNSVQMTPSLVFRGHAWDATASRTINWSIDALPVGGVSYSSSFDISHDYNGAARTKLLQLGNTGSLTINNGTNFFKYNGAYFNIGGSSINSTAISPNKISVDSNSFFTLGFNTKTNVDAGTTVSDSNTLRVEASGNTAIGSGLTSSAIDILEVRSGVNGSGLTVTNSAGNSRINLVRTSTIANNDALADIYFSGYNGTANVNAAEIFTNASEAWDGSKNGVNMFFANTLNGTNSMVTRMGIFNDGKVAIGNITPTSLLDVNGDIEIPNTSAYYFGDPTTDGSYRLIMSGADMLLQIRVTGVWTNKHNMSDIYTKTEVDNRINTALNGIQSAINLYLFQNFV